MQDTTHPDWVPHMKMGYAAGAAASQCHAETSQQRYERLQARNRKLEGEEGGTVDTFPDEQESGIDLTKCTELISF